jgi:predicted dehydrogenase
MEIKKSNLEVKMFNKNNSCIIIGLGRMGEKYISVAKKLKLNIKGIYDKNTKKGLSVAKKYYLNKKVFFSDINEILKQKPDIAIIASTADSHFDLIRICSKQNIKKIMVEKPLTISLSNCKKIKKFTENKKIKICVNHPYRFSKQFIYLKKILNSKEFGEIVSLNYLGANLGVSMNGVHFFDILKFLTDSNAIKVNSSVKIDKNTNPRGSKFKDFEGQISIFNKNGTRGYVDLSAKAGNGETLTCICKFGIIFIDFFTGKMIMNYRQAKYRNLSSVYYSKPFISKSGKIKISNIVEITKEHLKNFIRGSNYVNLTEGINIMKVLIASITSSEKKRSVNLDNFKNNKKFYWA